MSHLFNKIIALKDDPYPELTHWIQASRTQIPDWKYREPVLPKYDLWNQIQDESVRKVETAWATGSQTVVGCGVTGFGKTKVSEMLIANWLREKKRSIFYTHRKAIFRQTHRRFLASGISHGCRASGYKDRLNLGADVQLAMIQSERASVKTYAHRDYHDAHRVIIDEAHANAAGYGKEIYNHYLINEANILLLTATPVGLGDHQAKLVYFGRPSEMREIRAIVPAEVLAPNEVDLKDVKRVPGGEFSSADLAKKFMVHQIVGSVVDHLLSENPELRPTLLFAPDVESSLWFCDELRKAGISACSIDGEDVYFGQRDEEGQRVVYKSNEAIREYAEKLHHAGIISVVCNRFVFVMGVDWPWIEHIIFATAIGGTHMWIQACGRGLRAYPDSGKQRCLIQDHGGNWHRHPSPNSDIEWDLDDTAKEMEKQRKKDLEGNPEMEGLRCPKCGRIQGHKLWSQNQGKCYSCGFTFPKSERVVLQTDGKLVKVTGPVYQKQKKSAKASNAQKTWDQYFWSARNANTNRPMTFKQLVGWFNSEQNLKFTIRSVDSTMMIRDLATGTEERLGWIPAPETKTWGKSVKAAEFWELQKPPPKKKPEPVSV